MANEFIAFGNDSIKLDRVEFATWIVDRSNPLLGSLQISTSAKAFTLPFDHYDVAKAAAAVGLGTFHGDWDGRVKAIEKQRSDAVARAQAEEEAVRVHADRIFSEQRNPSLTRTDGLGVPVGFPTQKTDGGYTEQDFPLATIKLVGE